MPISKTILDDDDLSSDYSASDEINMRYILTDSEDDQSDNDESSQDQDSDDLLDSTYIPASDSEEEDSPDATDTCPLCEYRKILCDHSLKLTKLSAIEKPFSKRMNAKVIRVLSSGIKDEEKRSERLFKDFMKQAKSDKSKAVTLLSKIYYDPMCVPAPKDPLPDNAPGGKQGASKGVTRRMSASKRASDNPANNTRSSSLLRTRLDSPAKNTRSRRSILDLPKESDSSDESDRDEPDEPSTKRITTRKQIDYSSSSSSDQVVKQRRIAPKKPSKKFLKTLSEYRHSIITTPPIKTPPQRQPRLSIPTVLPNPPAQKPISGQPLNSMGSVPIPSGMADSGDATIAHSASITPFVELNSTPQTRGKKAVKAKRSISTPELPSKNAQTSTHLTKDTMTTEVVWVNESSSYGSNTPLSHSQRIEMISSVILNTDKETQKKRKKPSSRVNETQKKRKIPSNKLDETQKSDKLDETRKKRKKPSSKINETQKKKTSSKLDENQKSDKLDNSNQDSPGKLSGDRRLSREKRPYQEKKENKPIECKKEPLANQQPLRLVSSIGGDHSADICPRGFPVRWIDLNRASCDSPEAKEPQFTGSSMDFLVKIAFLEEANSPNRDIPPVSSLLDVGLLMSDGNEMSNSTSTSPSFVHSKESVEYTDEKPLSIDLNGYDSDETVSYDNECRELPFV